MWVWLRSHSCLSPQGFSPRILPTSGIKADGFWLGASTIWPLSKVLRLLPLEGECINVVEEWLSLEGKIVRYSSVSLSPTLGRNEKVEQYIRKKNHKPNILRFWVEGGVIFLYGLAQFSFLWDLPGVYPLGFSQQVVSEPLAYGLGEYSLTLYRKSSWRRFQVSVSRISVWTAVQVRGHE